MINESSEFNPQNVVVIGASDTERTISRAILGNLPASFKGNILPVNPGRKMVLGLKCYPSITTIDLPVDLAVIAVPALTPPWNGKNPIDLVGDAGMANYAAAITVCLRDPNVDVLLVIHTRHAEAYPVDLANFLSTIPNNKRKNLSLPLSWAARK